MSKPSRRPTREARQQHKLKRRAAQRQLCARRAEMGRSPRAGGVSNRVCPYSTEAEEQAAREDAVAGQRYLISQCYPIAIDGTQKIVRNSQWLGEEWLERRHQTADGEWVQQYVYVLETNLVFHNGVNLPLLSEFLNSMR